MRKLCIAGVLTLALGGNFLLGQASLSGNAKLTGNAVLFANAVVTPAAVVTAQSCYNGSPSPTYSLSCTTPSITAGYALLVVTNGLGSGATITIADTNTGTVISAYSGVNWTASANAMHSEWVIANAGAGAHTITVSYTAPLGYAFVAVVAISGASATSPIDSTATFASGSSSTTATCNSVTTSNSSELIIGWAQFSNGASTLSSASSPQTMTLYKPSPINYGFGYATVGGPGSQYAVYNGSASANWMCTLLAIH